MQIGNEKLLKEQIEVIANINDLNIGDVISIMEEHVFPKTIRQGFTKDTVIETKIDRDTFKLEAFRVFNVIPKSQEEINTDFEIYENDEFSAGEKIKENIDVNIDSRNSAIVAKQVLNSEINKLKKKLIREEALQFKENLINVVVKRYDLKKRVYFVEFNGEFSGIIPFDNLINSEEKLKVNTNYWALMTEEEDHRFQDQVIFSRKGDDFIKALFSKEIPEVHDEVITIKGVYSDNNKKIVAAVHTSDKNIEPVGTCVGAKGSRVNSIIEHINGGSIDICKWEPETSDLVLSMFKDLNIEKISVLDNQTIVFIDEEDFQTLSEQNKVRLRAINKFSTDKIRLLTEERFSEENKKYIEYFKNELLLDEESATLIANSGFYKSVDDLTAYSDEDTSEILDIDIEIAEELKERAMEAMESRNLYLTTVDTDLKDLKNIEKHHIKMLIENNISTISDLADLANDELCDIIPIDIQDANDLIMESRHISWDI